VAAEANLLAFGEIFFRWYAFSDLLNALRLKPLTLKAA
jgi:hypothetical protein